MVKVYNKRYNDAPSDAVYVGRPTKWGNKYTHITAVTRTPTVRVSSLEECLNRYMDDLTSLFADKEAFEVFGRPLVGKDLVCWCVPPGGIEVGTVPEVICHAQVLAVIVALHDEIYGEASHEDTIPT